MTTATLKPAGTGLFTQIGSKISDVFGAIMRWSEARMQDHPLMISLGEAASKTDDELAEMGTTRESMVNDILRRYGHI
ncbi:hypothetical protein IV417_03415 [Alphaproteobacteria bacterium KMM 3653]|uniref:Uncharacterized protein n=1 Tax=Harenicola maris TaxID=2841044 RepID=A0AAP2CL32_9RHOB|nr:hypothetical protein [Harenicola maris]